MSRSTLHVIAKNYYDYRNWRRANNIEFGESYYIANPTYLVCLGDLTLDDFVFTERWYDRDDYDELVNTICYRTHMTKGELLDKIKERFKHERS